MQRDLVERAARGEVEAFDALVRLASGRLFAIAQRILRDQYMAEARRERRGGSAIQLLPGDADASPAPDQYGTVVDRDRGSILRRVARQPGPGTRASDDRPVASRRTVTKEGRHR